METPYTFEWDFANMKHILEDNAARAIDIQEVESVFDDPGKVVKFVEFDEVRDEQRFSVVGLSKNNRLLCIIFVLTTSDLIRPITYWKVIRGKLKTRYENGGN